MDDRSEGRIDGCTRYSCNSFLTACWRRKLNCLSLTFALALSFAPSGLTHGVIIRVQVWRWIRERSRAHHITLRVFLSLSTKCFTTQRNGLGLRHGRFCEKSTITAVSTSGHLRQWCQGLVLVRPTFNWSTRKRKQRNVAWPY